MNDGVGTQVRPVAKRVLVTGGMGFLGRHLLPVLLETVAEVRVVDVFEAKWKDPRVSFFHGGLTDTALLSAALEGCDTVFHLASSSVPASSNADPVQDIENNLIGTVRLLEACREAGCGRIIHASSGGTVYGNISVQPVPESHATDPISSYGIVKLAAEKYLAMYSQLYGMHAVSLRISNLYGEHQRHDTGLGAIAAFAHNALTGKPIEIWGDGTVERDFVHVSDVVSAMYAATKLQRRHLVVNIGSGRSASLNEVIDHIANSCGFEPERKYTPSRKFDVQKSYLDISAAAQILHWKPQVTMEQGIERVISTMRASLDAKGSGLRYKGIEQSKK